MRFLGYVNPYLCNDGTLYQEALAANYLATHADGSQYLVDFGEFDCGVVDFTNPAAARWFEERVIRGDMLDRGLDGWMADFGEYLPTDLVLANGVDAMLMHNAWPTLWAEVNARAIAAAGTHRRRAVLHARGLHGRAGALPAVVGRRSIGGLHAA